MVRLGTPYKSNAFRVLLLGAGELGKEVVIELQRLGVEVMAADRYAHAPAMQVAHHSCVINMLDAAALRSLVEDFKPNLIVPEIEAIATDELIRLESEGYGVVPSARAASLTMNREGIRRLAAETLGVQTSVYRFADDYDAFQKAVAAVGTPCVVKPVMSSSGKGQSVIKLQADVEKAWRYAQEGGRAGRGRVIVEGFVDFDYEITLLTVRHAGGVSFCEPIGHFQIDGDYRESWQPQPMSAVAKAKATEIADRVTESLGGRGIFGVEFFVRGDEVWFSEVSPRPHDTGLVTLISQDLSQFALHVRAILGLPVPAIRQFGASASSVILPEANSETPQYACVEGALMEADTQLRLFGKPDLKGRRRMGVVLARGDSIEVAREKAGRSAQRLMFERG